MKNLKNKVLIGEISNHVLYNVSNYNTKINNTVTEILNKFVSLILSYMRFITEKMSMSNKVHFRFIFERGLETIIHVFSVIFYYTKNLELTCHHTQQSYYFYIEFIEQITDDTITYLQLTSKDAIMFVYKKTIFNLNNDYKKNIQEPSPEEKSVLTTIDAYITIYKHIIQHVINHNCFNLETNHEYIIQCGNSIESISEILNKNKIKNPYLEYINLFIKMLEDKKLDPNKFFKILNNFIKQIRDNKKHDCKDIKNKIYDSAIDTFIDNNESDKIVDWILDTE
jgi:hypothetical protein